MKRVVTGHNQDSKSVFVSIGEPPLVVTSEHGNQIIYCWGTQRTPVVPASMDDPTPEMSSHFPESGGTSFFVAQLTGNSESRLHTTDTVDYVTVVLGEVWLVVDDGAEVHLKPGDCVVQNRTQHAWHNREPEPCVVAAGAVGAKRRT